jgi:hypothetical protein
MSLSSPFAAALGILLGLFTACTGSTEPESLVAGAPVLPPVVGSPAVSEIYDDAASIIYGFPSRYVLYQDDTFGLQIFHPQAGILKYSGRFSRAGSEISFWFTPPSREHDAIGVLSGDVLAVRYISVYMIQDDFRDGEYVRSAERR